MPIVAVISASSGELINLLYGNNFIQASAPLSILIFGNSLFALSLVLNTIISAIGRPWIACLFYFGGVIVGLLCNLYLIGRLGIFGAGAAISIAYAFCLIGASVYIYRLYKTLTNWKSLLRILTPAILIYFIARIYVVSGILLPIYYIVLFVLYGVFVFILGELNREDYQVVQGIFGSKLVFSSE
jgi:O-antigen/teichoic acid export membrane protein